MCGRYASMENCIYGPGFLLQTTLIRRTFFASILVLLASACSQTAESASELKYDAAFHAYFVPAQKTVKVSIEIQQSAGELRSLDLNTPTSRFSQFSGDGEIHRRDERVLWRVPRHGGTLSFRVVVDHQRNGAFDARISDSWAILRLGDLFPPARVRSRVGATSISSLSLEGPEGWSFETRYGSVKKPIPVVVEDRRFDRPTGWVAAGKLGIRRSRIANRRVAIAAPVDVNFRRVDMLAFLRWTLPALIEVFPGFPERLLIVGASDNMWRGGLSGPGSLYVHTDRSLISENGTSTLLHELVHVATSKSPAAGDDWIVEGLAEYYGLEILRRTGGIGERRFVNAMDTLEAWVDRKDGQLANPSTGADTARAVLLFHALAMELAAAGSSLDVVVKQLFAADTANRETLLHAIEQALGRPSKISTL